MDSLRELADRLISCGFSEGNAVEICRRYISDGQAEILVSFVEYSEILYREDS